jgi:UDP-3-O-[3-hydroxymyristoyl] glucosamine N-acyltransferase
MNAPGQKPIGKRASVAELAAMVGGLVEGDGTVDIMGVASLEDAGDGQISFLADLKQISRLERTRASALIVPSALPSFPKPMIRTPNPYAAYAKVQTFFVEKEFEPLGVDPRAYVAPGAQIGQDVSIHPFAYVGKGGRIEDRVVLFPGVYVGEEVHIGEGTILYPNVVVMDRCRIGKRVIVHGGTVIGGNFRFI